MDWLVVSNIALWVGFIAMVLVNLALARQIGVLYERVAPAGALMMNRKLAVGAAAPKLAVVALDGGTEEVGTVVDGKSQLLFFLSPDCPVCNELTPALKSAARAESDWLRVVLASDGDEQDHRGYIERKGLQQFPYVVSELLGKTYGVAKLPYAVLIDEQGVIASMGIINSREHLDSLFEAKERKVASIQDYMSRRSEGQAVQYVEADKA
ncbi:MAG: redoxin domain-containing protein [Halioglobus sp.]|nr:redoxin domain-containing protein [Halioglobus sp.]MCB1707500.1 redoxin domain-containing protein [Halioglobus sp.]MCP5122612.1 redoxin domain-containing protein [Pseudomonadales bacterium]MCP5191780.1 redoxin domain-containing protein [Pseudomonadales bacterium]